MTASYAQLTVTGNNIANANTAGYSRQSVELETAFSQQTGNGFFGKGVNVATVTRAHSDFLIREAALAGSLAAGDAARSSQLSQLENVFRLGEAGLGYAAQQMFNAFVDVANRPQDSSARQSVLARVGELASRFTHRLRPARRAAGRRHRPAEERRRLDQLADDADRRPEPADRQRQGHRPRAQRPARPARPGDRRAVAVRAGDDARGRRRHASACSSAAARSWCSAATRRRWSRWPTPFDPSKLQIGISEGGVARAFPDGFIAGGSVAGLLRFQNHDLADARGLLGQLAAAITGQLNAQQALGLDLGTPSAFGGPLLVDRRARGGAVVEQRDGRRRAGRLVHQRQRRAGLERQHQHRRQPARCSRATTS